MIEYLIWRRSLDPTRFASYHPNLSPALARVADDPDTADQSARSDVYN